MDTQVKLPDGIEMNGSHLDVKSAYRKAVNFDDILPGDVIFYRGKHAMYCYVDEKSRDHMCGWHFGSRTIQGGGGWAQTKEDYDDHKSEIDRVSPSLAKFLLQHYRENCGLEALESGASKGS